MKFNEKLIELRKKAGLSQEELGYKLNVTRQTVSKWELGQTTPDMDKLTELSKIFNVSVDELVNEAERVVPQNKVIEDQPMENGGTKENKVKIIIIGILVVVLIWIIVKMVTGFTTLNNVTGEQGFFDKFFGMFSKVSSEQQNMIGVVEGMFNNVQNIMGNTLEQMDTTLEQMDTIKFNGVLEIYKGSNSSNSLKSLLDEVVTKNKTEQRKIIVKYNETETQDTEAIKALKANIKDSSNYEVSFEYDEEGFIYEVNIERVFSEFEKKSFNGSFEIYAGSNKGFFVISVLDNIITSNKTEDRKITVKYMETETQSEDEIKNIKYNIENFDDYEISFGYDADGFINEVTIEKL